MNKVDEKKRTAVPTDFTIGDQVLCYEPDTSKAKMLYEARILETDVTKDDKGKKVPEYFIHFIGWNKSWDRWVLSESVLKDCDASRQLQKKLYEQAVGNKKRPRSRRQKQDTESDSIETASQSNQSTANSSQAEGDNSQELQTFISINIPNILKSKLEDDCYYIKRKKKLLKLPRTPNAMQILRDYLQYCESQESNDNQCTNASTKTSKIDIVQEVMEGLQTYLNFTLSSLLLYNFEKEQYDDLFVRKKAFAADNEPETKMKESGATVSPNKRKALRNNKVSEDLDEVAENGSKELVPAVLSPSVTNDHGDEALPIPPKKRGRPFGKRRAKALLSNKQKTVSRRDTRAKAQIKERNDGKQPAADAKDGEEHKTKRVCTRQESNEIVKNVEKHASEKESLNSTFDHEKDFLKDDMNNEYSMLDQDDMPSLRSLRPRRPLSVQSSVRMCSNDLAVDQISLPVGASASSMEKSKTDSSFLMEYQKQHGSVSKDSPFVPFPLTVNDSKSPAEIYGVEHLLRLFVKLPSIISRSELDSRKRLLLVEHLEMFLRYLAERTNGLFDKDHYSESVI